MHVNLLPSSFVWRRLVHKRLRQWGFVFAVIGVVVLLCNATLFGKWWRVFSELQESQAAADPIRRLQQERIKESKDALALEQKTKRLLDAVTQDHTNSLLGIVARGVLATNREVQIQELQLLIHAKPHDAVGPIGDSQRGTGQRPNATAESKSMVSEHQLTLRGIAFESESITTFMHSLQESKTFSKVELRSTQERLVSDRSVQEFQLECLSHE